MRVASAVLGNAALCVQLAAVFAAAFAVFLVSAASLELQLFIAFLVLCPVLAVPIATFATATFANLFLSALLWLPSCSARTVSDGLPLLGEELQPSVALPPLPPSPSFGNAAAAAFIVVATAAVVTVCFTNHRHQRFLCHSVAPVLLPYCADASLPCHAACCSSFPRSPPSPPPMVAEEQDTEEAAAVALLVASPLVRCVCKLPATQGAQAGYICGAVLHTVVALPAYSAGVQQADSPVRPAASKF